MGRLGIASLAGLSFAGLALVGCASSDGVAASPSKPGEGVAANPGGKPRTAEEQALADKMSQAGTAQSVGQGNDAARLSAALQKGGKP